MTFLGSRIPIGIKTYADPNHCCKLGFVCKFVLFFFFPELRVWICIRFLRIQMQIQIQIRMHALQILDKEK